MRSKTNTFVVKNVFLILLTVFALSACSSEQGKTSPSSARDENTPVGIKVNKNTESKNNNNNNTNATKQMDNKTERATEDLTKKYQGVKMKTTLGDITIKLYGEKSPITVNNFLNLAKADYFDGIKFHRVIPNFMIQGGDPLTKDDSMMKRWGTGGPGYAIKDEFIEGLSNVRGSIAMANAGPNTGGSQFFINVVDNTNLDWDKQPSTSKHPVFGMVVEGMDVVDKISKVKTTDRDRPVEPVVIKDVELLEKVEK